MTASQLVAVPRELLLPYQQEALDENLRDYVAAMEYSLDFTHAGHNLGNLYTQLGDPAKAEEYYHAAIAVDDLAYGPKVNLALLLNTQGRNDEAEVLLREVLAYDPEMYEVAYEDIKEKIINQEVLHKKKCEEMESKYRALRGRYRFLLHKLKKNAPKTYRIFNELETNNI